VGGDAHLLLLPPRVEKAVDVNDLAYTHSCLHPCSPPSVHGTGSVGASGWRDQFAFTIRTRSSKQLWQGISHIFQVRILGTIPQVFSLSVPAMFWLLMATCWCKSNPFPALSPHPGWTNSMGAASPSSGHGGAPARCRWSARCPGSTPRGPPCGEHSKEAVLANGHCLDLLPMRPPPHCAGQECHEQPPLLPQLCHGP